MQSLPYSNDIPYTIKSSLLPNGVQRSKNLIILNQFLNHNSSLAATQSLMETHNSPSETNTNNSLVHISNDTENELHNLNQTSQNISFNLTEFIADRIEKSLHEDSKSIKNNKLTKVVAKTVFPINPISSIKCQITSPIHITPKNSIFPVFKNHVHKPHLLYAPKLKNETQKSLNLHCLELMDDGNIAAHDEECAKSSEQKVPGEILNKTAPMLSPQKKQLNPGLVQDLINFKKVDKLTLNAYNYNSNILPVSVQQGRESNAKDGGETSLALINTQNNYTKLGVLTLPPKTLNLNAALTNSILPNTDDAKKLNNLKTFVSPPPPPHSLRSPGNIVGINAKEFQHLIFMNHKSQAKTAPHLPSNHCSTTTMASTMMASNSGGTHEVISFSNKSFLVKPSTITQQQPNHLFASPFLHFSKPPPPGLPDHHHQTSKFVINSAAGSGGGTKYASSYTNYLTSPPHHSVLSFNNYNNNLGSSHAHNIVTCQSTNVRSTPLIMSTHATEPRPLPPAFSIYGPPTIIKPTIPQELTPQNLLSYNHQCNALMNKSPFYTLEKSNGDPSPLKSPISHLTSNPSLSFPSATTHPHTLHLTSPLGSPRKKQPRKQNLTLNKRGPELPDMEHPYGRCLEHDPSSSSNPLSLHPNFTFDSYTAGGRSSQKYKKSGGNLSSTPMTAVKKYREKKKNLGETLAASKPNGPHPKKFMACQGDGPATTDHRYRRTKDHRHNVEHDRLQLPDDINRRHPPLQTLLQCATVVASDTEHDAKTGRESLSSLALQSKTVVARGKYKREKKAFAGMIPPGKKRKPLEGGGKRAIITIARPDILVADDDGDQDLKSEPQHLGGGEDDASDPGDHEDEPKYMVDGDGVRWKVISANRGTSPSPLPRITDNNSFYQGYKANPSAVPPHHFLRHEDVKAKDSSQHNSASSAYGALEFLLINCLPTPTPNLSSPPYNTPNPYQSPSTLSNPSIDTIKDSCLKPATWKLLFLTSRLDYLIHRENQHIKYLRSFKDALFDQKLTGKWDGAASKSKLQFEYLKNYVDHRTDPDVKLYELIMASLQRSMFVKNELLESRRMLLSSLTTEYQSILMHGLSNISQLNNGSYPNRPSSNAGGPLYSLFCSIAKKIKRS